MSLFRKILIIVLSLVFVFCAVNVIYSLYVKEQARKEYDESKDIAKVPDITSPETTVPAPETTDPPANGETTASPETTEAPEPALEPDEAGKTLLRETDIASLKAQNPDIVGWIVIPDSNISYPMVIGTDNEFYLYHTWAKRWNWAGAIYLDYRMDRDFGDFNTIIYGHNMEGGDMFANLLLYRDQAYYDAHPYVYVVLDGAVRRYDIFAAYEADVVNGHTYSTGITKDETKKGYLDYCMEQSTITCAVTPKIENDMITLSTCTHTGIYDYKTRWVVQATMAYELTLDELPEETTAEVTTAEVTE